MAGLRWLAANIAAGKVRGLSREEGRAIQELLGREEGAVLLELMARCVVCHRATPRGGVGSKAMERRFRVGKGRGGLSAAQVCRWMLAAAAAGQQQQP